MFAIRHPSDPSLWFSDMFFEDWTSRLDWRAMFNSQAEANDAGQMFCPGRFVVVRVQ